jgi:hypothetical protein
MTSITSAIIGLLLALWLRKVRKWKRWAIPIGVSIALTPWVFAGLFLLWAALAWGKIG